MTPLERDFDLFWLNYPRRKAKGAARKAFEKALKLADIETICDGALQYARDTQHTEAKYIAHPATWLNGERWDDEPDEPSTGGNLSDFSSEQLDRAVMDGVGRAVGVVGAEPGTPDRDNQASTGSGATVINGKFRTC